MSEGDKVDGFSEWLGQKLRALNTDDGVFGSYIQGILDGDETSEEKVEALEGILSEIAVSYKIYYSISLTNHLGYRRMTFLQFVKK